MPWTTVLAALSVVGIGSAINRPVYKIAVTQKGYAQFLQYDVETPPLREFTFCSWVRVFDLDNDQSIFTYVANGNNRVVRLWLDTGGKYAKISFDEKVLSNIPVDFVKDTWRHVCFSYQSDHGAWALYIDSRLISCEAAQSLHGHILPGGGSLIVGYGIATNGIQNGLEGEIFGVNMILSSTIERNYTIKSHPQYKQKTFEKNKVTANNVLEYIVLGNMKNEKIQKRAKPDQQFPPSNASKSYVKFKTPYTFFEHDVGTPLSPAVTKSEDTSTEPEIIDLPSSGTYRTTNNDNVNFWDIINDAGNKEKFQNDKNTEIEISGTQPEPTISEYETPPPLKPLIKNSVSFYDKRVTNVPDFRHSTNKHLSISDIETPPPPSTNIKVYGQWTSSKFASSVLTYLKSINFNQREQKKVPPTIPLFKISDSFPYASDIKVSKVRPSFKFQRRNFVDHRRFKKQKRDVHYPEINVQILHDDLRHEIIESHAQTQPQNVEVTNRGESTKHTEYTTSGAVETQQSKEDSSSGESLKPKTFKRVSGFKINKYSNTNKNNKLLTILPFLKTLEYYIDDLETNKKEKTPTPSEAYSKSLANANKWHNVKSYSNDYTPRQINMEAPLQNNIQEKIAEANKKLSSIRLNYKPESQKLKRLHNPPITQSRYLANDILSNKLNHYIDSVTIINYDRGLSPGYDTKSTSTNNLDQVIAENENSDSKYNKTNFNKHVKLGNALNEQDVIGRTDKQNKQSFVGGDEKIPDVNRYRSDIDRETGNVPPSLGPKFCKNVELYDRLFYVQPDGSVDVTHILSPVRETNIGIEFIMQNYKKCSLEDSHLDTNPLLFIDWNKTPVRLFGGAYPKKTTDLCGFF